MQQHIKVKPTHDVTDTEREEQSELGWKADICASLRRVVEDATQREQVIGQVVRDGAFKDVAQKHLQAFIKAHVSMCLSLLLP